MIKLLYIVILVFSFLTGNTISKNPYIIVLGIAQDGGIPHTNCIKKCCKNEWGEIKSEKVSCLGLIDPRSNQSWLFDSTPDFPEQHYTITFKHKTKLEGIFLTHAHIGHYSGLMYLAFLPPQTSSSGTIGVLIDGGQFFSNHSLTSCLN